MFSKFKLLLVVLVVLSFFYHPSLQADKNPQTPQSLKDEMRLPWSRLKDEFVTEWLVLGEFPNPDKQGFDKDYLTEHGGEGKILPVEGMTHKRLDGSIAKWTKFHTEKTVDFIDAFKGRPYEHVVGYAFTTINRPKAGKIWLSLGSDDGVAVWLNGKQVHRNLVARGLSPDADQVEVFMNAGENHLLVKVEQGTGAWSFCLRIISAEEIILIREGRLNPSIEKTDPEDNKLIIQTDIEFQNLNWDRSAKSKPDRSHQFVRMAYRDEIDDSPQFCRVYLPTNYDPARKYPMVVTLHGYNGENPPYIRWWSVTKQHEILADRYNLIYIEPHGRGNTSYNGIGDRDVLRCIQMAKEQFNVDGDRVYLTGYSMGGGGTWHVGCRHPELFAAIAPIYGGWDYHVGYDEAGLEKLNEVERFLLEKQSSFSQAEALLSTPVCVAHGDVDAAVDVNNSRYAVKMLQRWGYNIRYWEVPGGTHGRLGIEDDLMQWFLLHKRNANPKHVRIRSAELKSASAHWVSILQRKNPYAFIYADVEVIAPNKIKLETENVLEITLSPGSAIVDDKQPLMIIWNGKGIKRKLDDGQIALKSDDYLPGRLHKRPDIEGPLADITNTPFAVVIGTISQDSLFININRN